MRVAPKIELTAQQQKQLTELSRGQKVAVRLAQRAKLVLMAAQGTQNQEIAKQLGISRFKVARWRGRFTRHGLAGIEKDATRTGRKPKIAKAKTKEIVRMTLEQKPAGATHWSRTRMAAHAGVSASSVGRIWRAHGLKPHRVKTFKLSNDKHFAEKLEDIVGLYLNPPEHAVVLSCDEKSQIQALDRTQPGLPLKKGRCATMTHDYKRNGTTSLFAALNIADGSVLGNCMKKHRHQEWIRFLNLIVRSVPKGKDVHVICDNYATHKHDKVKAWQKRHPRFHFHFTPTSASWLNMVERFFRDVSENWIRRGVFHSVADLEKAIADYLVIHNQNPKPFIWTAKAADILQKVVRGRKALDKLHSV
jgi:transposase